MKTIIKLLLKVNSKPLDVELKEAEQKTPQSTPNKNFSRSLSGVESTPIDIIIPPELRASKSTPVVISDEDLDFEIEKIKSMRNGNLFGSTKTDNFQKDINTSPKQQLVKSKSPSPKKETVTITAKGKKNKKEKASSKMVQKDMVVVGEKLTSLKIDNDKQKNEHNATVSNGMKPEIDLLRHSSERDSANHSPSDVMMASPSLSSISDNHSEVTFFHFYLDYLF